MQYLVALILSFTIVVILVPVLRRLAATTGFVDKPTERKQHKVAVPLVGGVAIFISFLICTLLFLDVFDSVSRSILIGSLMILSIGIIDDFYKTRGREFAVIPRLLIQMGAAVVVYLSGIRFTGFMNPFTDVYFVLPVWLQFVMTILWIFGVTTVLNFIDGMDGLAGSMAAISSLTLFIVAVFKEQPVSAMLAIIVLGSVVGFLKFNLFPAKIFMGDSGANFLGFILAVISLHGAFKHATIITMFIPVLALGVPIFDNIFVVLKRIKDGKKPYEADRTQIQFRLLNRGLSPVQVLTFLCLVSVCLNLTSIIILLLNV